MTENMLELTLDSLFNNYKGIADSSESEEENDESTPINKDKPAKSLKEEIK